MLRDKRGFIWTFFTAIPLVFVVGIGALMTGLAVKGYMCEKKTGRTHAALDEALKDCKP